MSIDPQTGLPIPQKSSGGCFKSCMTMGCFGVILMGLCCGGMTWFFSQSIQVQEDPQIAAFVGQEIATGKLTDEFKPTRSVKVELPFVGPVAKVVVYEGKDGGLLTIGEIDGNVAGAGLKDMIEQMLSQEMHQDAGHDKFKTVSQKTRQVTIGGKASPFSITHAKGDDGHGERELWIVRGSFEGKTGPAFVFWIEPHDKYTEDQLAEKLETLN